MHEGKHFIITKKFDIKNTFTKSYVFITNFFPSILLPRLYLCITKLYSCKIVQLETNVEKIVIFKESCI